MAKRKQVDKKIAGIHLAEGQWFPMKYDDLMHIEYDHNYTRFEALSYLRMALQRHGKFKPATYYKKIFNWPCSKRVTRLMHEIDANQTPNKRQYNARKKSYKSKDMRHKQEVIRQLGDMLRPKY